MVTAAALYRLLSWLSLPIGLKDVCVFTAPFFAGNTVRSGGWGRYGLTYSFLLLLLG